MRKRTYTVLSVVLLVITTPLAGEEVVARVLIPQTGEPASVHNPNCAEPTDTRASDVLIKLGANAIDSYIGYPIISSVVESQGNKNWVKVRLGVHNGPSYCSTQCVVVPRNVGAKFLACLSESGGNGLECHEGPADYSWGRVENFTWDNSKSGTVFCARGKNWSDGRDRYFIVKAVY